MNSIPQERQIIFVPDQHLGRFAAERTGRNLVLWPGYCTTHIFITENDIKSARARYPDAIVMAHPECSEAVKDLADELLSTGQMLEFVKKSKAKRFIVATETGMIHPLKKANGEAEFIEASSRAVCPNMKKITLEKVAWSLEDMQYKIALPQEIRIRAKKALDRMVEILPSKVGKD